ncbi:MAG: NACHT domain-containing protein [Acaryochloridaceae cyanobacterium RU_4_10]|nr:NACHT domain-containing protein [Acaryochloridaceae cyanobacterium RU_4_10]
MAKNAFQKVLNNLNAGGNISIGDVKVILFSLFGQRSISSEIDWDWVMRVVLKPHRADIKSRLRDLLSENGLPYELADVDLLRVNLARQEDSPALALESAKILTIDGTKSEEIDSRLPIIQTYEREDIQGKLLILGAPGAGKTITLLKLAEQLVGEAINKPETVIPIIFELSTWQEGQEIEDWLIEQLHEKYRGDRRQYKIWLKQRVLLPLLDGLDELGLERQRLCMGKVNEFAGFYPHVVVCCRTENFLQVGERLPNLRAEIQLQPLSDEKIKKYLAQVGKLGLWEQIQSEPEMKQLLETVYDTDEMLNLYLKAGLDLGFLKSLVEIRNSVHSIIEDLSSIIIDPASTESSEKQIEKYLDKIGKPELWNEISWNVRVISQSFNVLNDYVYPKRMREAGILRQPFFLKLAAQSFEIDKPFHNKRKLLEHYIETQLDPRLREKDRENYKRKLAFTTYQKEPSFLQTKESLAWLACRMRESYQVELLIEGIQPSLRLPLWTPTKSGKFQYLLLVGLFFGIYFASMIGLAGDLSYTISKSFLRYFTVHALK